MGYVAGTHLVGLMAIAQGRTTSGQYSCHSFVSRTHTPSLLPSFFSSDLNIISSSVTPFFTSYLNQNVSWNQ